MSKICRQHLRPLQKLTEGQTKYLWILQLSMRGVCATNHCNVHCREFWIGTLTADYFFMAVVQSSQAVSIDKHDCSLHWIYIKEKPICFVQLLLISRLKTLTWDMFSAWIPCFWHLQSCILLCTLQSATKFNSKLYITLWPNFIIIFQLYSRKYLKNNHHLQNLNTSMQIVNTNNLLMPPLSFSEIWKENNEKKLKK